MDAGVKRVPSISSVSVFDPPAVASLRRRIDSHGADRYRYVVFDTRFVRLSHYEFKLLHYLAERRDQVVTREELLSEVWGYVNPHVNTRSVDQTIFRLRQKIEVDPHQPVCIRTAHRDGYCLSAADDW
jgi:DNA-binding response OmpR family regulator